MYLEKELDGWEQKCLMCGHTYYLDIYQQSLKELATEVRKGKYNVRPGIDKHALS